MNEIKNTIGEYEKFLDEVFANLEHSKIDVSGYFCDHLGFRASSEEHYHKMKDRMQKLGEILGEVVVSGRGILVVKLENPIQYKNFAIPCVEVLAPKPGFDYGIGLEHVEFVVDMPLKDFMAKYPDIEFITKSLDRQSNPEIGIMFGKANVKFHNLPVEEVVKDNISH